MNFNMKDSKKKGKDFKKKQYYVQYLGWKECRGLGGREYTEPIVKDLVIRRKREELPKLTIEVTKKELKIVQLVPLKKGKTEKVKYPTVPIKDVSYATQGLSPDEDVVACIYLGFNPTTRCAVHVHVYRCDSAATADLLVLHLHSYIGRPEHTDRMKAIEQELVVKGEVTPRPRGFFTAHDGLSTVADTVDDDLSSEGEDDDPTVGWPGYQTGGAMRDVAGGAFRGGGGYGGGGHAPGPTDRMGSDFRQPMRPYDHDSRNSRNSGSRHSGSHDSYEDEIDPIEREKVEKFSNMTAELMQRLGNREVAPILLPPQDYDTIHRTQGNLIGIEARKCLEERIVGGAGGGKREEDDSARGDSEHGSSPRERRERQERHSGYVPDGPDDIIPISPHWKKGEQFMPPPGERGRPTSPGPYGRDPRRAVSPTPRDGRRPLSPSRNYERNSREGYPPEGGKKYTASKLGLADPRAPRHRSDEGYTSMDRDFPSGFARNPEPSKSKKKDKQDKKGRKDFDDPPADYMASPAMNRSSGSFNNYRL